MQTDKPTASQRIPEAQEATTARDKLTEEEYERGLAQARKRATWELGDPSWAGVIIGAFFFPDTDAAALKYEQDA